MHSHSIGAAQVKRSPFGRSINHYALSRHSTFLF